MKKQSDYQKQKVRDKYKLDQATLKGDKEYQAKKKAIIQAVKEKATADLMPKKRLPLKVRVDHSKSHLENWLSKEE